MQCQFGRRKVQESRKLTDGLSERPPERVKSDAIAIPAALYITERYWHVCQCKVGTEEYDRGEKLHGSDLIDLTSVGR